MDFAPSAAAQDYTARMRAFLDEAVLPAEKVYEAWREERRGTSAEQLRNIGCVPPSGGLRG